MGASGWGVQRDASANNRGSAGGEGRGSGWRSIRVGLLALAFAPFLLVAQQTPNASPGFRPEGVYDLQGIDQISLFNGGLTLSIPIGLRYPVNGGFSYQLTLQYSSAAWDGVPVECSPGQTEGCADVYPKPTTNAGLGWRVSLGELVPLPHPEFPTSLVPRWAYVSPDGTEHVLYGKLHRTDPEDSGDTGTESFQKYMYARDGSYIRMNCATLFGDCALEMPNGERHLFHNVGSVGAPEYQLIRIEDRFSNGLDIARLNGGLLWELSDGHRTQRIYFFDTVGTPLQPRLVDRVELTCFENSCTGAAAKWQFSYATRNIAHPPINGSVAEEVPVQVLTGVAFPGGAQLSIAASDYLSGYFGALSKVTLPTGGKYQWSWEEFFFPVTRVTQAGECTYIEDWTAVPGVVEKKMLSPTDTVIGTWSYDRLAVIPPGDTYPEHLEVTVTNPLFDESVYYFALWPAEDFACDAPVPVHGTELYEYGLPYTRVTQDPSSIPGDTVQRYLSEEHYDCSETPPHTCSLLRSVYRAYELDDSWPNYEGGSVYEKNRRLLSERTVFHDDGDRWKLSTWSEFDGVGHYRYLNERSNFDAGTARDSFTNFKLGSSAPIYPGSYSPPLPSAPWILGLYDATDVAEEQDGVAGYSNTERSRRELAFDGNTGFLQCARTLRLGVTRGATDLLTKFSADADGNVTLEEYLGGDLTTLGTGSGCGVAGTVGYGLAHTYSNGVRATSQYTGLATSFKILDRDIDAATGLPSRTRDASGLGTDYEYDALGRTTKITPLTGLGLPNDAWTKITYTDVYPFEAVVERCKEGQGSCTSTNRLTSEYVQYDAFGRLWHEGRRITASTWNYRATLYDAAGNRRKVTSWVADGSGPDDSLPATTYSSFDPFGRPRKVTPPDGNTHEVNLVYTGARVVQTTSKIALASSGAETAVPRYEVFDGLGRLLEVQESSIPGSSALVATRYSYDEASRLRRVCQNRTTPGGSEQCGQERLFDYDNRGFLLSERHPEKGGVGNGFVTYGSYDARGHARLRDDGHSSRRLRFRFDRAERLEVVSPNADFSDPLKSFAFDGGTGAGLGRVWTASSFARDVQTQQGTFDVEIRETYSYSGRQGRVSHRLSESTVTPVVNAPLAQETWSQAFTWTNLGQPATLTYPTCTGGGCDASLGTAPNVVFNYDNGLLASIPGYATQITYHPNLTTFEIHHSNATIVQIANDPNAMPRPYSIQVSGTALDPLPALQYSYDGSGNVKAINSDSFTYDRVNRLIAAVPAPSAFQNVTYDSFGNIQALETHNHGLVNTPTSATTNRLSSPAVYDASGNLTSWNGQTYQYDLLNRTTRVNTGTEEWVYAYTADDERIWAVKASGETRSIWTVRDLEGQVLRRAEFDPGTSGCTQGASGSRFGSESGLSLIFAEDFESGDLCGWDLVVPADAHWNVSDYVWRGANLLAATGDNGVRHFHLDHLASPRLITGEPLGEPAEVLAYHVYQPFGEEVTSPTQDAEVMKFTGHERDLRTTTGQTADDLDYMHARTCSPLTGRFLSTDPLSGGLSRPQGWNLYSYVRGNPMRYVDSSGRGPEDSITVTATDPCPSAPEGVSCADYERLLGTIRVISLHLLLDSSRQIAFGDDSPGLGPSFFVGLAMGGGGSRGAGMADDVVAGANSARTAAGGLKVLKPSYLKNLQLDAEAAKEAWLGTEAPRFNIAVDGSRRVYFVPVQKGAAAPIEAGKSLDELRQMFPRSMGR